VRALTVPCASNRVNDFDALLQSLFRRAFDYFFPDAELLAAGLEGVGVRQHARTESISKRAP
jgi:hypothetical protein